MTRSPGSWCGLAPLGPLPTMAKFTRRCPAASSPMPSASDTWISLRPTRGISPPWSTAATLSAACAAARSAAISLSSFTARSGDVTLEAANQRAPGRRACSASSDWAQARSEMP